MRIRYFYVFLFTWLLSGEVLAACTCTTIATNEAGQVTKEDCGASCGVKEYRYDGDTRYTTTTKTESGNIVIREETHIKSKSSSTSYSVTTAYKETEYDAQNNPKKIENRYYTLTESSTGTKSSSLASGVVISNTYQNGLLVSATETNKIRGSSGSLVNEGTRNKITYTYDDNQKLISSESVLQVSVGTNKWEEADPPVVTTNKYASNGTYETYVNGKMTGKYNADGTAYLAKRIYTVDEATKAIRKGGKNSFSIRYR